MLTKCQGYLIFNWETLILVNVLKDQELAVATSAFISTDILEAVYEKKIRCDFSCFPPRCALVITVSERCEIQMYNGQI